jgi:hypothetical protein
VLADYLDDVGGAAQLRQDVVVDVEVAHWPSPVIPRSEATRNLSLVEEEILRPSASG